jgi:hypothetical protein
VESASGHGALPQWIQGRATRASVTVTLPQRVMHSHPRRCRQLDAHPKQNKKIAFNSDFFETTLGGKRENFWDECNRNANIKE